ncbi:D-isomer specific 2-hydroxyacid dehydrogenase family protein [Anaerorhabdus sp.]|uniref:D-isomer specific 2-hydroxyacid dehydrogenase family protein n=1 Tax=Anaerorhabdus sp. TaxID=1872524 RepID=UPI002FC8040E
MKKYKIAIVNSSSFGKIFTDHKEKLQSIGEVTHFTFDQHIPGKELAEELKGYNIIISSVTPFFGKEFFENKDELLLISRHGIGYNNIDLEAAEKHDTIVSIVPALVEQDAVAENNITNLLAVMRKTVPASIRVRNDKWEDRAQFLGNTLYGKTVGLIGVGNTGSRVVETVRLGFRCRVLAYDPYKTNLEIEQFGATKVELEDLLKNADVICVCASLNDKNYHMISTKEVEMMKNGVYISNSARGALLSEDAIIAGLKNGKISGFASDVLETEPGRANHPYLEFDNVVLTPHTSAYTSECLRAMGEKCVEDVVRVTEGILPGRAVQPNSSFCR